MEHDAYNDLPSDSFALNTDQDASEYAFEAPSENDRKGIKDLLKSTLMGHVDCEELVRLIVAGDKNIKSLVVKGLNEEDKEVTLCGLLCFIPLLSRDGSVQGLRCFSQLKALINSVLRSKKFNPSYILSTIEGKDIAIIFSQFLFHPNLPMQEKLIKYLEYCGIHLQEEFELLVFICKCEKVIALEKLNGTAIGEYTVWNNPEEEILLDMADFEVSISMEDTDDINTNTTEISFSDPWTPAVEYRKLLFVDTSNLDKLQTALQMFHK